MKPYEAPEIQEKLNIIKESVLAAVPDTIAIYLFGSYAYGEPHKDSDLDICVVVPDHVVEKVHPLDVAVDIGLKMPHPFNFPMDMFVKGTSVFEKRRKGPTIDKVVANRGVKFYDRI